LALWYLERSKSNRMKPKYYLILLLQFFGSSFWAQNGIGVSYSSRIFPFQDWNNESNPYLNPHLDADAKTSSANEQNLCLYFQKNNQKNGRIQQFGINVYQATLDFSRTRSSSYGDQGVGGYSSSSFTDVKSATYNYCFIGFSYSSLKSRTIVSKLFVVTGINSSLNFLASHKMLNKVHTTTNTSSGGTWNSSSYDTYSNTTTSTDQNISDPQQLKFNLKMELPLYVRYSWKSGAIHLGGSLGISTQSRVLTNDKGFNLFYTCTLGYTYFLN